MIGTVNSVSVDDFMGASGARIAVERSGCPEYLEGHPVGAYWSHFRFVIWREGYRGELHLTHSIKDCEYVNYRTAFLLVAKSLRVAETATKPEDLISDYGKGFIRFPELAEGAFYRAKGKVERARKVLGEWYEYLLAHVDH